MKNYVLLFLAVLISLINAKGTYKIHSHSGSWCDYETKLGKVNIQIIKESGDFAQYVKIKMTLIDESKNEYPAECTINNNDNSYCLFTPTTYDTNLYYKKDSLTITEGSDIVKIEDDLCNCSKM